ncbi:alpha-amylase family glycosyl hydrolase [Parvularcula oceani]|uniref:alpha-amylase family glycosyl hydrolase n=1 Tax=Parvularcula oceani TaxID=1247963 RepID=UPI00069125C3|nr:alpha-amylase family glycosyl hydrolase [Parvularcula oceani]
MTDQPWWQGAVLYQIYPRSFRDTSGNGVGDLPGIAERLDYVARLGVDGIWMSPFYPSPGKDFGYDITEHCKIDPLFGTMEDFQALLDKAHSLGLKVVIDAVLNHTSDQHPWFLESRSSRTNGKADWYQWEDPRDDGGPPNNWICRYGQSQWSWCPEREQYYRHQYLTSQPALNLANQEVVEARLGFMEKWLSRGVDGLRFDAVPQYFADADLRDNPPADPGDPQLTPVGPFTPFAWQLHENDCNDERIESFVASLQDQVECAGCTFTFSEIDIRYDAYRSLGRYTGGPYFNAAYTPDFMSAALTPSCFAKVADSTREHSDLRNLVWTVTNHDASRIASRWTPEDADPATQAAVSRLAAAILMCLHGQISFFQGEELGLPDAVYDYDEIKDPQGLLFWPKGHGRDPIRHPFPWDGGPQAGFSGNESPWLPMKDTLCSRHAAGQEDDPQSVLNTWRRLIGLRRGTPALRSGEMEILEADDESGILHLRRWLDGQEIEALFCLAAEAPEADLPEGRMLDASSEGPLEGWGWRIIASAES